MTVKTGGTCTVEGCEKPMFGRTWCGMHYATWRKYGDPVHPDAEAKRRQKLGPICSEPECTNKPKARGLCVAHVKRMAKYGETTDPFERRFWAKVDRRGPDECWEWLGFVQPNGYGVFGTGKTNSTSRLVHRIAHELLVGPIPDGLVLDHLCHTRDTSCRAVNDCPHRRCCNPMHAQPVSKRENIARGNGGDSWGYTPDPLPVRIPQQIPLTCTEDGGRCGNPIYKRTICRKHYRRWLRDPAVERPSKRTPEQRFWAKVDKDGPIPEHDPELGQCWLWTGTVNSSIGYGNFYPKHGFTVGAHRYAYELAHGPIPDGCDVHHKCHTRRCVRHDHLSATDRSENMAQRKVRRKQPSGI